MEQTPLVSLFLDHLKSKYDSERAVQEKRYHKSQREHWGTSVPTQAKIVSTLCKNSSEEELLKTARTLWEYNVFDTMMCSCKILSLSAVTSSPALWDLIVFFLNSVDGWALEDGLCHAAWKCLLTDDSFFTTVETWTRHPCLWMRRAALVYTLPFAKPGRNPERMLGWASLYASDPEWFIQKAIGWWLRVLGEHNPERVISFLNAHWPQLKSVAKKEATRKLTPAWTGRITNVTLSSF